MRLLSVGSLNIDRFYDVAAFVRPGETRRVDRVRTSSGGKGLNQSISSARAGLEVLHVGRVGRDGEFLLDELRGAGVDTSRVHVGDEESGSTAIQVDPTGQNCILVYGGANQRLERGDILSALDDLKAGDVVLLQNETNLVPETIRWSAERGLRVAFNASPLDSDAGGLPLELLSWLFVNEVEGEQLTGESDTERMVDALTHRLPGVEVVLTLGDQGSVWACGSNRRFQRAFVAAVVDTTAAGDTFTGYFLRGALSALEGISPLELASAASALAISRRGASSSIPALDEVLASPFLDKV